MNNTTIKVRANDASVARKQPRRLSDEVRELRDAFETYTQRASKELQVARKETERLARRVHYLEQIMKHNALAETSAAPTRTSAKSLFTFLGRRNQPSLS